MRVLIVDDSADLREYLGVFLRTAGHTTIEVADGSDVDWSSPTEAAVVDLMMPGMSGLDVLRKMRDEWPDCRRVLWSAKSHGDRDDTDGLAHRFVLKDGVHTRELLEAIRG